ncbi:MAG: hypothetical protein IPL59_07390 [Candidatus Competibacteraceae bacterium]|nr:hypothetical protein [Candidatus Competibacteraceae bacterium]MBK8753405.1 hypothetical protein [Candidatus Competibacteraceae bacterium]
MTLNEINRKYAQLVAQSEAYFLSLGASPMEALREAESQVYRDNVKNNDDVTETTWHQAHAFCFLELEAMIREKQG